MEFLTAAVHPRPPMTRVPHAQPPRGTARGGPHVVVGGAVCHPLVASLLRGPRRDHRMDGAGADEACRAAAPPVRDKNPRAAVQLARRGPASRMKMAPDKF